MGQWWEHSPPTNLTLVQILASTPYVGWVCCWFYPLLQEVFLRVLLLIPLLQNQRLQIPIRPEISRVEFSQVVFPIYHCFYHLLLSLLMYRHTHPIKITLRGRPFDFWGRGGYGWLQRKISCILILREKISFKEIPGEKTFLHWKKYLPWLIMLKSSCTVVCQKKIFHQRFLTRGLRKKIFSKPNHPYPPSLPHPLKSEMVGP